MIRVRKLRVSSFVVGYLDLFWEIEDTVEDALDYTFVVERSESPGGPWDAVTLPFTDKYVFRDSNVPSPNRWRQLFYRIKIEGGGKTDYSVLATREAQPDLVVAEMRRMMTLLLQEGNGRTAWVFPVRTFGTKCPTCYDPVLSKRISSNCLTCFNTGYARGYMAPIAINLRIDPSGRADQLGPVVKSQQQNTMAHTSYYPPLKPYDVIIEAENRRWRVVEVRTPERLRAPVWQNPVLHEIPASDVEFKLPINIDDLSKLQPSPERAFSNPQNPEEAGSALASFVSSFRSY